MLHPKTCATLLAPTKMSRIYSFSRAVWSLIWGVFWIAVLHPYFRRVAPGSHWVIGGHRGRHYGDNSAAVEAEARRQGKQIFWLANPELSGQLGELGVATLVRHSWAARKAISRASLLIYSHGEDDLDLLQILLRGRTAPRIYLDHCMCTLKAGGMTEPTLLAAPWPIRKVREWLLTRWDYVLCASEEVRRNFHECYPMNPLSKERARLSGGAHLDEWQKGREFPPKRQIYWFPTFRESAAARARLLATIEAVVSDAHLKTWLEANSYRLFVGTHINSGEKALCLKEPFVLAQLESLTRDVRESELFISDYSGIVYDFLMLERPQILFAFDLEDYTKRRHLFGRYEDRDFALHPRTAAELIEMVTTEKWRDPKLAERATAHRLRSLPAPTESYAKASVDELGAILSALREA